MTEKEIVERNQLLNLISSQDKLNNAILEFLAQQKLMAERPKGISDNFYKVTSLVSATTIADAFAANADFQCPFVPTGLKITYNIIDSTEYSSPYLLVWLTDYQKQHNVMSPIILPLLSGKTSRLSEIHLQQDSSGGIVLDGTDIAGVVHLEGTVDDIGLISDSVINTSSNIYKIDTLIKTQLQKVRLGFLNYTSGNVHTNFVQ